MCLFFKRTFFILFSRGRYKEETSKNVVGVYISGEAGMKQLVDELSNDEFDDLIYSYELIQ